MTIVSGITHFFDSHVLLRLCFVSSFISFIIQLISFSTNEWSKFTLNVTVSEGLWYRCYDTSTGKCCQSVDDFHTENKRSTPGWIYGTIVFQCLCIFVGFLGCVLIVLSTCFERWSQKFSLKVFTFSVEIVQANCLMLSIIIYAAGHNNDEVYNSFGSKLSLSFGFALFVALTNVIIVCLWTCYFCLSHGHVIRCRCCGSMADWCRKKVDAIDRQGDAHAQSKIQQPQVPIQGVQKSNVQLPNMPAPRITNPVIFPTEYPRCWAPHQPRSRHEVVDVLPNTDEYRRVKGEFLRTIGPIPISVYIEIQRVQNKDVYDYYSVQRRNMTIRLEATGITVERKLWHGTSDAVINDICTQGFNRSYCGKNATVYGEGTYFAVSSSYSAQDTYSPPNQQGYKHVFQWGVLTGKYCTGNSYMKAAPVIPGTNEQYDSTVDNDRNPSMSVIYTDYRVYPEYIITFKV